MFLKGKLHRKPFVMFSMFPQGQFEESTKANDDKGFTPW